MSNVDGFDVEGETVFEQAELFEALSLLERRGAESVPNRSERGTTVGVEAQVLPVGGEGSLFAVVGDGCAAEVKRAAVERGNYL